MSHYTVAVIHSPEEDIDNVLAPFCENVSEGDEYADFDIEYTAEEVVKELEEARSKHPEFAGKSDDAVMREWAGGEKDEDGNWGYWRNPEARWDWYVVGGRWRGLLKLKEGASPFMEGENGINEEDAPMPGYCDSALIKDVDFEGYARDKKAEAEDLWLKHQEKLAEGKEDYNSYYRFGIEKDETKEQFIQRTSSFHTYSVLENGEWKEAGKMGWFGMGEVGEKKDEWDETFPAMIERWKKQRPNDVITIVDCHT